MADPNETASRLAALVALHDSGQIGDEEFNQRKLRILRGAPDEEKQETTPNPSPAPTYVPALTEEDKRRIYEEEKERDRARAKINGEKMRNGCIGCFCLLIIISLIPYFIGLFFSSNPPRQPSAPAPAQPSQPSPVPAEVLPISISADDLYSQYNANEVAADARFKGRSVLTTGSIKSISRDILNDAYVIIGGGGFLDGVQCFFPETSVSELAKLSKGQIISIRGRVKGKMGNVLVESSSIANVADTAIPAETPKPKYTIDISFTGRSQNSIGWQTHFRVKNSSPYKIQFLEIGVNYNDSNGNYLGKETIVESDFLPSASTTDIETLRGPAMPATCSYDLDQLELPGSVDAKDQFSIRIITPAARK